MRLIRRFIPLLLLAGLVTSDETEPAKKEAKEAAETFKVELTPQKPDAKVRIGYSAAKTVDVETTVPRFILETPKFNAANPLFFRIVLGEKDLEFYGALDKSEKGKFHDLIYLDKDRDSDLTNDGEPLKAKVSRLSYDATQTVVEFVDLALPVTYTIDGAKVSQDYRIVLFFLSKNQAAPTQFAIDRDGWREGAVTIGGTEYTVALVDDDTDGRFLTGDSWNLVPKGSPRETLLSRDTTRSMVFPSWSSDQKLNIEVATVDPAGRFVELKTKPAKETEDAFWLRVYRARQSPEAKALGIDPRRPQADPADRVEWLVRKDIQYALDIAKKLNKRVLVDFYGTRCIHCARMTKFTMRDREIVDLAKQFVCIKIEWKAGSDEARKYDIGGTPTYVVLDTDGIQAAKNMGFAKPVEFSKFLKSALK